MSLLERIVRHKRAEVEYARRRLPLDTLRSLLPETDATRDFAAALSGGEAPRIIAEVKRASPSRGLLKPEYAKDWQPGRLAQTYRDGGAVALSVLTDINFFWGHHDTLSICKESVSLPVLRKDFIVDAYQVDESRWLGADALLLIVRLLEESDLRLFAARALELGMTPLVEIHADEELDAALSVDGAVIGINHRDLDTLAMDLTRAERLRPRIPSDRIVVAESGLSQHDDLVRLSTAGIDAFLVGEHLASSDDPRAALEDLRK